MKTIVFATNNEHKLKEVRTMMPSHIEVISLADIHCSDDIPETADTLEGNALLKARYIHEKFGSDCFADDTGLEVESLNGGPGVYSARYAGAANDSKANMQKLLQKLSGITNRKARFRTIIALVFKDKEYLFEGVVNGYITKSAQGECGFGYDPVFIPENYGNTFAELGDDVKNTISHRAKAVKKLSDFLFTINE